MDLTERDCEDIKLILNHMSDAFESISLYLKELSQYCHSEEEDNGNIK